VWTVVVVVMVVKGILPACPSSPHPVLSPVVVVVVAQTVTVLVATETEQVVLKALTWRRVSSRVLFSVMPQTRAGTRPASCMGQGNDAGEKKASVSVRVVT